MANKPKTINGLPYKQYFREYRRKYMLKRKNLGLCSSCSNPINGKYYYCDNCLQKMKEWRQSKKIAGECQRCGAPATQTRCEDCYAKNLAKKRTYQRRLKIESLIAYGGCECAVCGITDVDMLTIDHKNNNGGEERRKYGYGQSFYSWLKKNGYPRGYQVLCYNHNIKKERVRRRSERPKYGINSKMIGAPLRPEKPKPKQEILILEK